MQFPWKPAIDVRAATSHPRVPKFQDRRGGWRAISAVSLLARRCTSRFVCMSDATNAAVHFESRFPSRRQTKHFVESPDSRSSTRIVTSIVTSTMTRAIHRAGFEQLRADADVHFARISSEISSMSKLELAAEGRQCQVWTGVDSHYLEDSTRENKRADAIALAPRPRWMCPHEFPLSDSRGIKSTRFSTWGFVCDLSAGIDGAQLNKGAGEIRASCRYR